MAVDPDGHIWFVETKANALGRVDKAGRVTEWPVDDVERVAAGRDGGSRRPLVTENFANKIGRMGPDGTVISEYAIPGGIAARAVVAVPDGRLFFSAHDAGAIGEVIPR